MKKSLFLCLSLALALPATTGSGKTYRAAQETAALSGDKLQNRVDDYLRSEMSIDHVPGLSVSVVREGRVVLARGYGWADVEHRVPSTPETLYEIGSMTKQFTAAAILLLRERGLVSFSDPISKHLDSVPESWRGISIRQLLTHTSGIKDYTLVSGIKDRMKRSISPAEILTYVASKPLDFRPGEKWAYSNTNYILLGLVIEKLSGRSYRQFLSEQIFGPLGMANTFVPDGERIPGFAQGYNKSGDKAESLRPEWGYAAGGIVSNVVDLAKWGIALQTASFLNRENLDLVWTPTSLNDGTKAAVYGAGYGMGWLLFTDEESGHKFMEHAGGTYAFRSYVSHLPADSTTVFVLCNMKSGYSRLYARAVAAMYVPWMKRLWEQDEEIAHKERH